MPLQFLISPCGCAGLVREFSMIHIIDSNKLVGPYFEVISLVADGVYYEINSIFESQDDFNDYLNETFKIIYGWKGNFPYNAPFIDYENVEEFTSIEVVAIILTEYKTVEITTNTDVYQDSDLIGKVLDPRIVVDNQLQCLKSIVTVLPIDFDDNTGTISNLSLTDPSLLHISYRSKVPA